MSGMFDTNPHPAAPSEKISSSDAIDPAASAEWKRASIKQGLKDGFPTIVGSMPFGMLVGSAATAAGMDPWMAMAMSVIVYAGASQLAALGLMLQAAPAVIVVATVLVVNLRFVLYSATLAPFFRQFPLLQRAGMAYLITDHVFALVSTKASIENGKSNAPFDVPTYYLAITIGQWISWQITVALGIFLGTMIPKQWSLDFAIPLVFIAIVMPALATRSHWVTAITASVAALFTAALPLKLGLIAAAITGVAIGSWLDWRDEHARKWHAT
jgi:predicted branched-subunit amino acid permease